MIHGPSNVKYVTLMALLSILLFRVPLLGDVTREVFIAISLTRLIASENSVLSLNIKICNHKACRHVTDSMERNHFRETDTCLLCQ